jgi:LuxR family transcriptional regulator
MPVEVRAQFSTRELEVLRWTGEGKTSGEIGMIMGLSAATVNFYVQRLLEKTGGVNRTHAAVRAVALGILPVNLAAQSGGVFW